MTGKTSPEFLTAGSNDEIDKRDENANRRRRVLGGGRKWARGALREVFQNEGSISERVHVVLYAKNIIHSKTIPVIIYFQIILAKRYYSFRDYILLLQELREIKYDFIIYKYYLIRWNIDFLSSGYIRNVHQRKNSVQHLASTENIFLIIVLKYTSRKF